MWLDCLEVIWKRCEGLRIRRRNGYEYREMWMAKIRVASWPVLMEDKDQKEE